MKSTTLDAEQAPEVATMDQHHGSGKGPVMISSKQLCAHNEIPTINGKRATPMPRQTACQGLFVTSQFFPF